MRNKFVLLLSCLVIVTFVGCGKNLPKPQRPQSTAVSAVQAQSLRQELNAYGAGLSTYKALGKIVLKKNGSIMLSGRAGWSAEEPDKLSLVAFAAGIPVMRMACDGKQIYYADSFQNTTKLRYYMAPNSDETMYDYLGVYISTQSLLGLWCGKLIPQGFSITGYHEDEAQRCVILTAGNGDARYIYLNKNDGGLRRIDDFTRDGGLRYTAYLEEVQTISGYRVPFRVFVTNTVNTELEFVLDNAWINVPTNPGMFVLWEE